MLVTSKGKTESTQGLVNASIQVLIDALESGHSEVLTSYLTAMAKFHHYSFGNILLIATQKPTGVAIRQRLCILAFPKSLEREGMPHGHMRLTLFRLPIFAVFVPFVQHLW